MSNQSIFCENRWHIHEYLAYRGFKYKLENRWMHTYTGKKVFFSDDNSSWMDVFVRERTPIRLFGITFRDGGNCTRPSIASGFSLHDPNAYEIVKKIVESEEPLSSYDKRMLRAREQNKESDDAMMAQLKSAVEKDIK